MIWRSSLRNTRVENSDHRYPRPTNTRKDATVTTAFALLAESPKPPTSTVPDFTYDRQRQVNVTRSGKAVTDHAAPYALTMTHNSQGFKKDDDFQTPSIVSPMLFGPTMTHNSSGLKQDDA